MGNSDKKVPAIFDGHAMMDTVILLSCVTLDGLKGLVTENMLQAAGIFRCHLFGHTKTHKEGGEEGMALVNFLSHLLPCRQKGDIPIFVHGYIAALWVF